MLNTFASTYKNRLIETALFTSAGSSQVSLIASMLSSFLVAQSLPQRVRGEETMQRERERVEISPSSEVSWSDVADLMDPRWFKQGGRKGKTWDLLLVNSFAVSQFRVWILWRPHLKANYVKTQRLSQFEGSSRCSPQMWPFFPCFWRMDCYYPSWPHISQDSLRARKSKKERKRENGNIAWRRSSLLQAWAAEIMTQE